MFASREVAATVADTGNVVCDTLLGCTGADAPEGCIVSGDGKGPLVRADNGGNGPLTRVAGADSGPLFMADDDGNGPPFTAGDDGSVPFI
jgi:hypothetical protein